MLRMQGVALFKKLDEVVGARGSAAGSIFDEDDVDDNIDDDDDDDGGGGGDDEVTSDITGYHKSCMKFPPLFVECWGEWNIQYIDFKWFQKLKIVAPKMLTLFSLIVKSPLSVLKSWWILGLILTVMRGNGWVSQILFISKIWETFHNMLR